MVLVVAEGGYVAEEGGSAVAEEGEGRDWHRWSSLDVILVGNGACFVVSSFSEWFLCCLVDLILLDVNHINGRK